MQPRFGFRMIRSGACLFFCVLLITALFSAYAENGEDPDERHFSEKTTVVFPEGTLTFEEFCKAVSEKNAVIADLTACEVGTETLTKILSGYSDCEIRFTLEPYGITVDSAQELLVLDGITITDIEPLKQIVPYFKNLKQIDMCGCGIDNETMDALDISLDPVRVVWTVDLRHWQLRTDATHFATWDYRVDKDGYICSAKNITSNTSKSLEPLKYCRDLVALDLGHNKIKDISFLSGLTNLKYLIIALNEIKDISPLSGLKKLKYLEIFNNDIQDITPLAELPKLEALYMTAIPVKDISCLYGNPTLRLLYLEGFRFNRDIRKEIESALPECTVLYRNQNTSNSHAWRVYPYYTEMRRALGWRID